MKEYFGKILNFLVILLSISQFKLNFQDLNVDIPLNHLIPRLPQRANYILWIEDLLNCPKQASGIDIGLKSIFYI
jgi:23S rRNA A1618 N6-methylase RlmF